MAIVSGYQKMKDYIKQSSGYKLLSRWANANTLECDDGKTLQSKVGGISGISSSLTANSTTQAASTNLTNQLYQNINQLNSDLAESKKWTLLNVAADLEISQEMINTHEEFLITVVSNDTVLGSIILPAWHSIFQSGEYVGKYLHLGGWYHNAENCGMIQIYKFRDIGWTTNPDLHCCSIDGQYVTVNIALFGR